MSSNDVNVSFAGNWDTSVQIPPQGKLFTFYALVQEQPEANGMFFYVHFVTTERFQEVES